MYINEIICKRHKNIRVYYLNRIALCWNDVCLITILRGIGNTNYITSHYIDPWSEHNTKLFVWPYILTAVLKFLILLTF